jgi:hypothetical protein
MKLGVLRLAGLVLAVASIASLTAGGTVLAAADRSSSLPQCENGLDDDRDGLIDWPADPGCFDGPDNDEYNSPPPPPPPPAGPPPPPPPPPPSQLPHCENGLDDDGDGLIDWPADPGCFDGPDNDEYNSPPHCSDGYDNDGDGRIDYPNDPGCASNSDLDEYNPPPPAAKCADGVDNDGDGKVDYPNDPGCTGSSDDDEADALPPDFTAPQLTDNRDTPAVVRAASGSWSFWLSNDFQATVSHQVVFGSSQSTPLVGDWDGDGIDSPGVNIGGNRWVLANGYDDEVDHDFYFGAPGDQPVVGDWNGDGIDTVGVRRNATFYLSNGFAGAPTALQYAFGLAADRPLAGDFNGDGVDTPALRRNQLFFFKNSHSGGDADFSVTYGTASDTPLIGDWNADGIDNPGVHRGNQFFLSNDFYGFTAYAPVYGNHGDVPLGGDWNPDALDSWEDEAITEGSQYTFAAVTNDAPQAVVKYAPQVWIASGEQYRPASARRWFMKYSSLMYARYEQIPIPVVGRGHIDSIRLGEQGRSPKPYYLTGASGSRVYAYQLTRPYEDRPERATALHTGFFLDLKDDKRGGAQANQQGQLKVPVYYHYKAGRFITYWFFYPYSDGWSTNGDHEGDWERIAVRLDASGAAREIALYRHTCHKTWQWPAYPAGYLGTHPIVYSSYGSHASYEKQGGQDATCGAPVLNDTTSAGTEWRTWEWLADVQRQPWYGFGGAWGEKKTSELNTGPVGPSRWKQPAPDGWE